MNSKEFISPSLESQSVEVLTKQLFEANLKLSELQKEREIMLSNISHDLRAPITAIRGAIDLAQANKDTSPEELRRLIGLIDRRTSTLEDLINDMYYLFCVEDSSRSLNLENVDAGPFLEEYFYDIIADSRYDGFDMQLDIPTDLNCNINIDIQKFLRVLDNLFTNAAKYAGESDQEDREQISITLSAKQLTSPEGNMLEIIIADTGRGIPAEALPHLFTRTYTVSSARTPGTASGSGLGLSIAQTILRRHNGDIRCESEVNKGTKFIITIPAR